MSSINHFSTDLPEALWWAKQHNSLLSSTAAAANCFPNPPPHRHPNPTMFSAAAFNLNLSGSSNNNNNEDDDDEEVAEETEDDRRESLFEKPLTPSDVGKLNRLVIPKQHAEKHFPMCGGDAAEKGLLLSFVDEQGKPWKFRYSYWNSSQSYVLTKGWSRYVKEKRLDAGDVVVFERGGGDRLCIGWRRRNAAVDGGGGIGGWRQQAAYCNSGGLQPYHGPALPYQPDCLHAGSAAGLQSQTTSGNSKTVRIFGVNLECQSDESEPPTPPDASSSSSQTQAHYQQYPYHPNAHSYAHQDYMQQQEGMNFSRDINQMRYQQR